MPNRTEGPNNSLSGMAPLVEIKSKFDAEFRRFSVDRLEPMNFSEFYKLVNRLHKLEDCETSICYTDRDGDLLPINNDSNLSHALGRAGTHGVLLKLVVQRKGDNIQHLTPSVNRGALNLIGKFMPPKSQSRARPDIGEPVSFRPVSAIIDVDLVPATHMRVKLMKNGSDRPLGFYIRDGVSLRVTPAGVEKVPGIFISRLVPGGLAQHTGLLSVGDEVLEVNGIDVGDKTLDQVTDMMIANANNLIITVKPANQQLTLAAGRRNSSSARSKPSRMINAQPSQQASFGVKSPGGDSGSELHQRTAPGISQGSPSISGGSNRSSTARAAMPAKAETSGTVDDDSTSSDSDLEADEVKIHDTTDGSPSKANTDIAAVEHHQKSTSSPSKIVRDSNEENTSDSENYRESPNNEISPSYQGTTSSSNKLSKDSVLRI